MFEICCMVDDKKLVKFLKALDGLIVGQPKIGIVRGAKAKGDKVVSTQPAPDSGVAENVAKLIRERNLERVNSTDLRALLKDVGASPSSYSHFAKKLREMHVIGKGKRGLGHAVLNGGRA